MSRLILRCQIDRKEYINILGDQKLIFTALQIATEHEQHYRISNLLLSGRVHLTNYSLVPFVNGYMVVELLFFGC